MCMLSKVELLKKKESNGTDSGLECRVAFIFGYITEDENCNITSNNVALIKCKKRKTFPVLYFVWGLCLIYGLFG